MDVYKLEAKLRRMLTPKFLKWAAVGLIVIVIIVLSVFLRSGGAQEEHEQEPITCELRKEKPDVNFRLKNVAGSDNTSLANFRGYFVYQGSSQEGRYLPLQLKSLTWFISNSREQLELDLTCARMDFINVHGMTNETYAFAAVVTLPDLQDRKTRIECELELFDPFDLDGDALYSCRRQRSYRCIRYLPEARPTIGMLVINDLEYEANGDPGKISSGKFSKSALEC